jgi:hypothetical protein
LNLAVAIHAQQRLEHQLADLSFDTAGGNHGMHQYRFSGYRQVQSTAAFGFVRGAPERRRRGKPRAQNQEPQDVHGFDLLLLAGLKWVQRGLVDMTLHTPEPGKCPSKARCFRGQFANWRPDKGSGKLVKEISNAKLRSDAQTGAKNFRKPFFGGS